MALAATDKNQLYSDAFARNSKAMLGESAFAALDLMTQRDVATMEAGVLRDELAAVSAERDKLKADADQGQVPTENLTPGPHPEA